MENYEELPNRHRNHIIESLSDRFMRKYIPIEWVLNQFQIDYGTDYNCEITTVNGVTGNNFTIQLKGKEIELNKEKIKINLKRTTITRWLKRLEPTMIIVYICDEDEAFWMWFDNDTVDLTKNNTSFLVSVDRQNSLSKTLWSEVSKYIENIFLRKHLLYETPKISSKNEEAWKSFADENYEKAVFLFKEALEETPLDISMLEGIAISQYRNHNYLNALVNISKAIELKTNDNYLLIQASILTEKGFLERDQNQIREAIKIYSHLFSQGYSSYYLHYNFGSALTKMKKYDDSIIHYELAVAIDRNKPEVWNNLANSYLNLGMHEKEMECYDNALQLNPNLAESIFSKGSSLFRYFGKLEQGLELMLLATTKTSRHEVDNPYVFFWIAESYIKKGDLKNAKYWNKRGLMFFPIDKFLLDQKERILIKK